MNRKARALPDEMIPSAAPALAFLLYFLLVVPYNKQLNNLRRSVVTGKSQISVYRIDLAIARSIRQALSLRFSRNDFTPGH